MLTLLWIAAVLVAALVLAYVNASGLVFTGAIAVALGVAWVTHAIPGWATLALTLAFVLFAIPANVPVLRRKLVSDAVLAVFRKLMPPMSQTERDAIEAGTVWWDGELFSGRPNWQQLLATPASFAHRRRAAVPGRGRRGALRDGDRLGNDERLSRSAAARVAVHQGPRLPRDEHREGVRRVGLLGVRAFAGHDQAVDALGHGVGDGDGAELARTRRAPCALRHRRAEALLPAAACQGPGDSVLRAHGADRRIGRGVHSGLRRRVLGRARGPACARIARHLGQALHHARPGGDAARARVPRLRSRPSRRRARGHRHHVRPHPHVASRRRDRPPPHAAQCGVPERPQFGKGRLHSRWTGSSAGSRCWAAAGGC